MSEPFDEPGAPTYPVGAISSLLMLSDRRVQQLTKEGVIPKAERGRYELRPAVQGYIRYLQERTHGHSSSPADYHVEKARLVRAQADRAEVELNELNGSLVSCADVEEQWADLLANMKARLLALPAKLAPLLVQETEVSGHTAVVSEGVDEVLREFSSYGDEQSAEVAAGPDEGGSAAAETEGERMGGSVPAVIE